MKALILTDLNWNSESKKINQEDIISLYESGRPGITSRFTSIRHYWAIITREKPELVLLAGDLTGDGSCGHGFHSSFYYLLCLLDLSSIVTLFISGDNDLEKYYSQVTANLDHFKCIHEISEKMYTHGGINIGGISFLASNSKKVLKKTLDRFSPKVDLLLCHSPLKRRTSLMASQFPMIITGHFDNKVCLIRDSILLSFSNDSEVINYGSLEYYQGDIHISYKLYNRRNKHCLSYRQSASQLRSGRSSEIIYSDTVPIPISNFERLPLPNSNIAKDRNRVALTIKYLRGKAYTEVINFLLESAESESINEEEFWRLRKTFFTVKHKLSKTMLVDYLGTTKYNL